MREFAFDIVYESGSDPLMDVFIDYPNLTARSLEGCVTEDQFWRIERFSGPSEAVERARDCRFNDDRCCEAINSTPCRANRYHDILERTIDSSVIYSHLNNLKNCESIHTLSGRYLNPGAVFEVERYEDTQQWRILLRTDERIGLLYDALGAKLRNGLTFRMQHLREAKGWDDPFETISLSSEQQSALRAAVEHGYYKEPRNITLDQLAERLDIPRSTLSYRLRRAESHLASGFLDSV